MDKQILNFNFEKWKKPKKKKTSVEIDIKDRKYIDKNYKSIRDFIKLKVYEDKIHKLRKEIK